MQATGKNLIDPTRPRAEQIAELRRAVELCYCGLGPACPLWRDLTPAQRVECSQDKRMTAQYYWKGGMR